MNGMDARRTAVFLANLDLHKITAVYEGGDTLPINLSDSRRKYLDGKLKQATKDPVRWMCDLDIHNLSNFADAINLYRG